VRIQGRKPKNENGTGIRALTEMSADFSREFLSAGREKKEKVIENNGGTKRDKRKGKKKK